MSNAERPLSTADEPGPLPPAVPVVVAVEMGADLSPAFSNSSTASLPVVRFQKLSQAPITGIPAEFRICAAELAKRCIPIYAELMRAEDDVPESDKPHVSKAANELAIRSFHLHIQHEAKDMLEWLHGLLEEARKMLLLPIPMRLILEIVTLAVNMATFSGRLSEFIASKTAREQMLDEEYTTAAVAARATIAGACSISTALVEPPPDAAVDQRGRFVDWRYRLWHAHKEFRPSSSPEEVVDVYEGHSTQLFAVLSGHSLSELLEYATGNFAYLDPNRSDVGFFIEGLFLSLFGCLGGRFKTCGLYVRKCYVEYRKVIMDAAEHFRARRSPFLCRLTGNPGIGKSMFLVYHLLKLLEEAHRNEHATDDSRRELALRLKIFLSDGRNFYVYSRRTGWLQVKKENVWTDMHMDERLCRDAWLLVDGYDLLETACHTLFVSSPNFRNYIQFRKNQPCVTVLPTWSWDEVEHVFDRSLDLTIRRSFWSGDGLVSAERTLPLVSRAVIRVPTDEDKADSSSETAEFFSEDGDEIVRPLDKARIRKRFDAWGGVLTKLFSLRPLEGLNALFKYEKDRKLCLEFTRGNFSLFETPGVYEYPYVLHNLFEPDHNGYIARDRTFKTITERGRIALKRLSPGLESDTSSSESD